MYRRASPDLGDRPSITTRGDDGWAPSRAAPTTPLVPKELVSPTQPPSTSDAGSLRPRRHHTTRTRWPRGWVVDGPQTSLLYRSEYRAIKDGSRLVLHQAVRMGMCLEQVTARGRRETTPPAPPVKRHAWFVVGILHLVRSVFPFQSVRQHHVVRPLAPTADPHHRPTPPPPPSLQRSSPASPKAPSPDRNPTLPRKRPSWCRAPGPPPSAPARGQSP